MLRWIRVLGVVVACGVLAGCWGDGAGGGAVPQGKNPNSEVAASAPRTNIDSKDRPPTDNVLRMPLLTNPPDLDPILISDTTSHGVASRIFNTLVTYDENLQLVPGLCTRMPDLSADQRVYTFHLRPGVRFHHGRELTADDVRYSLSRLALTRSKRFNVIERIAGAREANELARAGGFQELSGVRVVDPLTVEITLEKPHVPFLFQIATSNAAIVPREVVEELGDMFSRKPVGTGPFKLAEWRENNFLRFERFDDFYLGRPKLAGMLLRVIPESLARQQEYEAGNLEMCDITSGMMKKWSSSNHSGELIEWPALTVHYYGFNLAKSGSPYAGRDDKRARKLRLAINHAVDREHLCRNVLENRYYPANGVIPPGIAGHHAERPAFHKDLKLARKLLAEAGHPEGRDLPAVQLWFNAQGDNALVAQTIQQDLAAVGIRIELRQLDWAAFIQAADAGDPPFFRLGWVADYPDPETFLYPLFHSSNKGPRGNVTFYENPAVDALVDQSMTEGDPAKRLALLRQAEEQVLADTPWLFLMFSKEVILCKPYVKNLKPTGMDDDVNMAYVAWHELAIEPTTP